MKTESAFAMIGILLFTSPVAMSQIPAVEDTLRGTVTDVNFAEPRAVSGSLVLQPAEGEAIQVAIVDGSFGPICIQCPTSAPEPPRLQPINWGILKQVFGMLLDPVASAEVSGSVVVDLLDHFDLRPFPFIVEGMTVLTLGAVPKLVKGYTILDQADFVDMGWSTHFYNANPEIQPYNGSVYECNLLDEPLRLALVPNPEYPGNPYYEWNEEEIAEFLTGMEFAVAPFFAGIEVVQSPQDADVRVRQGVDYRIISRNLSYAYGENWELWYTIVHDGEIQVSNSNVDYISQLRREFLLQLPSLTGCNDPESAFYSSGHGAGSNPATARERAIYHMMTLGVRQCRDYGFHLQDIIFQME